jgi:hypothetical protein
MGQALGNTLIFVKDHFRPSAPGKRIGKRIGMVLRSGVMAVWEFCLLLTQDVYCLLVLSALLNIEPYYTSGYSNMSKK